jgi:hypothetical protein
MTQSDLAKRIDEEFGNYNIPESRLLKMDKMQRSYAAVRRAINKVGAHNVMLVLLDMMERCQTKSTKGCRYKTDDYLDIPEKS